MQQDSQQQQQQMNTRTPGKEDKTRTSIALEMQTFTSQLQPGTGTSDGDLLQQALVVKRLRAISTSIVVPPLAKSGPLTSLPTSIREDEVPPTPVQGEEPTSRWTKFKDHTLKGLLLYLQTPLGFIVGVYGLLIVVWGAALVIILAGWTPMTENTKDIWVEICSQVLNGLFTITGVGFIPWRVRDAWHMSTITRYRRKVAKLQHRARTSLTLPTIDTISSKTVKASDETTPDDTYRDTGQAEAHLTPRELQRLYRAEQRFQTSQHWYRSEEDALHKVFPTGLALTITCLVVSNSLFQCMLCGVMWSLNRYQRPGWTTGVLIGLSFSCGLAAAALIWWGGEKTRKVIITR